jgi:hypothetical protein
VSNCRDNVCISNSFVNSASMVVTHSNQLLAPKPREVLALHRERILWMKFFRAFELHPNIHILISTFPSTTASIVKRLISLLAFCASSYQPRIALGRDKDSCDHAVTFPALRSHGEYVSKTNNAVSAKLSTVHSRALRALCTFSQTELCENHVERHSVSLF